MYDKVPSRSPACLVAIAILIGASSNVPTPLPIWSIIIRAVWLVHITIEEMSHKVYSLGRLHAMFDIEYIQHNVIDMLLRLMI